MEVGYFSRQLTFTAAVASGASVLKMSILLRSVEAMVVEEIHLVLYLGRLLSENAMLSLAHASRTNVSNVVLSVRSTYHIIAMSLVLSIKVSDSWMQLE